MAADIRLDKLTTQRYINFSDDALRVFCWGNNYQWNGDTFVSPRLAGR